MYVCRPSSPRAIKALQEAKPSPGRYQVELNTAVLELSDGFCEQAWAYLSGFIKFLLN